MKGNRQGFPFTLDQGLFEASKVLQPVEKSFRQAGGTEHPFRRCSVSGGGVQHQVTPSGQTGGLEIGLLRGIQRSKKAGSRFGPLTGQKASRRSPGEQVRKTVRSYQPRRAGVEGVAALHQC